MLRNKTYADMYLELTVNNQPGKFQKPDALLTDFIAYSYRPTKHVHIFNYRHTCSLIKANLHTWKHQFKIKKAYSIDTHGKQWTTTGIVVPVHIIQQQLGNASFQTINNK